MFSCFDSTPANQVRKDENHVTFAQRQKHFRILEVRHIPHVQLTVAVSIIRFCFYLSFVFFLLLIFPYFLVSVP